MLGRIKNVSQNSKILLLAAFILILIGSGAGLYATYTDQLSEKSEEQARLLRNDKRKYTAAVGKSNLLIARGEYPEAVEVLQMYVDDARDDNRKALAYIKIGTIYEMQKNYQGALDTYRMVESMESYNDEGPGVATGIARSAHALGQKDVAIQYYKKAADFYSAGKTRSDQREAESFKKIIADIEAER